MWSTKRNGSPADKGFGVSYLSLKGSFNKSIIKRQSHFPAITIKEWLLLITRSATVSDQSCHPQTTFLLFNVNVAVISIAITVKLPLWTCYVLKEGENSNIHLAQKMRRKPAPHLFSVKCNVTIYSWKIVQLLRANRNFIQVNCVYH